MKEKPALYYYAQSLYEYNIFTSPSSSSLSSYTNREGRVGGNRSCVRDVDAKMCA